METPRIDRARHRGIWFALGLRYVLPIAPGVAAGILLSLHPIDTSLLQPDSQGYIDFAAYRTAGYPMFLRLGIVLFGGVEPIVYGQLWIFALSVAYLGVEVFRLTGSAAISCCISIAILIVPEIHETHFTILTESLFISLTLLIMAQFAALARASSILRWAVLSGLTGLAIAIKPVGFSLVPLIAIALAFRWRAVRSQVLAVVLAATLPLLAVLGGEHFIYHDRHGPMRQSLAGIHLFAKAGLVEVDGETPVRPPASESMASRRLLEKLDADLRALRRFLAGSPGFAVRQILSANYEVFLQYRFATKERRRAARETGLGQDDLLWELALARLSHAPLGYLRLSWNRYLGLWSIRAASHPDIVPVYRAYIEANRPIPFEPEMSELLKAPTPVATARLERVAIQSVGVVTLGIAAASLIFWFLRGRIEGVFCVAALSAFAVHGNFLLIALTGVSAARYTLTMWPAMVVAVALLIWALMERAAPRAVIESLRRF